MQYNANQSSYYTLGHGLSSAPELVIARARVGANAWGVYYTVRGVNTNWARLNTVEAQGSNNGDPDAQGRASGAGTLVSGFSESSSESKAHRSGFQVPSRSGTLLTKLCSQRTDASGCAFSK